MSLPAVPSEDLPSPVLTFFDLNGAELALQVSDFSQQELVEKLILLARDPDPQISLQATSRLLAYLERIAKLQGHIGSAKIERTSTDASGNRTSEVAKTDAIVTRLRQHSASLPRPLTPGVPPASATGVFTPPQQIPTDRP